MQTADALPLERLRPTRRWHRALAGLTPRLAVFLAGWLLLRVLGTSADRMAIDDLSPWLRGVGIGYAVLLLQAVSMVVVILATANLGPQRGGRRWAALALAVVGSAGVGTLLRGSSLGVALYLWPRYAILGALLVVANEFHRYGAAQRDAARQAEIDRVTYEREMAEARMQVLQAQIAPHFLFNTLANVRRLYAEDRGGGREMLESLIRYLRVALPGIGHRASTLGGDAELLEAYLRIQQIRMGRRLSFAIDIPRELRSHPVPPMMLLTLAENAIKHGLAPRPGGGLVRVAARAEDDRIVVSVADTGVGFGSASGTGIGLANISARLAAEFGDRARLVLENNELGGATASILLPWRRDPGDGIAVSP
ncbi:MAG: sensor histidine kinase [Candidatus Levyibacteriota bacterium]